jgi:hypothetical protein
LWLFGVLGDGEVDGLEEETVLVGEDGRDDVDDLRQVGHLHDVRVADERVEEHAHGEGVFVVVDLLEAGRPGGVLAAPAGAVPDVPFVVRDVDGARVGASAPALHGFDQSFDDLDAFVDFL